MELFIQLSVFVVSAVVCYIGAWITARIAHYPYTSIPTAGLRLVAAISTSYLTSYVIFTMVITKDYFDYEPYYGLIFMYIILIASYLHPAPCHALDKVYMKVLRNIATNIFK